MQCGLWRENAAWVKKAGDGVWSRRANLSPGSRRPAMQCGLWRENAARVKKAGGVVWFVARKRREGQESRWCSVVCGEKTPRGSKDLVVQCGLWRENAARVKGLGGGVWSRRANLLPGSRKPVVECGLWRENAMWVKGLGGGVWFVARKRHVGQRNWWWSVVCGEKTPCGSKDLVAECGLGGRTSCLGQESRWWRVVCGEKTPRGSKDLVAECGLWRENAVWVKGLGGAVWSRRANLLPGSRKPVVQCG